MVPLWFNESIVIFDKDRNNFKINMLLNVKHFKIREIGVMW